jgi:acyl-CoA synthetase (AMP-forming)/AMP-acid ligase II
MLRRVALVRTDVSEERGASFIRVTRIGSDNLQVMSSHYAKTKYMKATGMLQIAHYRIPRYIRFTSEFTRTSTSGKVQKRKLLEKLLSEINSTN